MTMDLSDWEDAGPADEVQPGVPLGRVVAGLEVALYRVGDEVFATDGICTHGHARLCEGFQEGFEIECPLHQGRFDVRNGRALCEPLNQPVASFAVRLRDGRIWLKLV
jgi:naphthalene 1,2-dioxygenase ferredoxin component